MHRKDEREVEKEEEKEVSQILNNDMFQTLYQPGEFTSHLLFPRLGALEPHSKQLIKPVVFSL